jgi:hypothetical protein
MFISAVASFSPVESSSPVASFPVASFPVASFPVASFSPVPSFSSTSAYSPPNNPMRITFSPSPTPIYPPTVIVQDATITIKTDYVYAFGSGIAIILIILLMKIHDLRKVRKGPFTATAPVEPSKITVNPINTV